MTTIEMFLKELENESITTRKMLSIVPQDKFNWQPHPKSMTLIRLAAHIAELPTWIRMILEEDELDFEKYPYTPQEYKIKGDLLQYFEESLKEGKNALLDNEEADMDKLWTLRSGETVYSVDPAFDVLRMTFSQIIHHRAQLGVYLRLLDIKIPGSYGPSADEEFVAIETGNEVC